jgi:hypothetical protein
MLTNLFEMEVDNKTKMGSTELKRLPPSKYEGKGREENQREVQFFTPQNRKLQFLRKLINEFTPIPLHSTLQVKLVNNVKNGYPSSPLPHSSPLEHSLRYQNRRCLNFLEVELLYFLLFIDLRFCGHQLQSKDFCYFFFILYCFVAKKYCGHW